MFEILSNVSEIYVGDPCYIMDEQIYNKILGIKNKYKDGIYEHSIDGEKYNFIICETNYRNRFCSSNKGKNYFTKTGTISVIPKEFWKKNFDIKSISEIAEIFYSDKIFINKEGNMLQILDNRNITLIKLGDE